MCAVVKRTMRLRSLKDKVLITTAQVMFEQCQMTLTTEKLEFFYSSKDEVQQWRESLLLRYSRLRRVPAIRSAHGFFVEPDKTLHVKRYSSSTEFATFNMIKPDEIERAQLPVATNAVPREFSVGVFYAIKFRSTYQVGLAETIDMTSETITCLMMQKSGKGGIALKWPANEKHMDVSFDSIIRVLQPPYNDPDKPHYYLGVDDLAALRAMTRNDNTA